MSSRRTRIGTGTGPGLIAFCCSQCGTRVSGCICVLLWHQLKHYNVIIKMTNRITHDGKRNSRWMWAESNCTVAIRAAEGWYRLPICRGDRLKQFANCATYSNCLCATVLILCKPTNDSQVSRALQQKQSVASVTRCVVVRRWQVQPLIEITTHPPVWHNPLVMSPLVAYYRALRQLSVDFKGLPTSISSHHDKRKENNTNYGHFAYVARRLPFPFFQFLPTHTRSLGKKF